MKRSTATKITFLAVLLLCISGLFSCAANNGKEKLSELMYSDYTAEISFLMTENGETFEGNATVSKADKVTLSFTSPELLGGLSVESDENGESGILQFTYYGMRLPLPYGTLGKVNLLLSMFSKEMAGEIASLPQKSIEDHTETGGLRSENTEKLAPKKCTFTHYDGKTECTLIYDSYSGYPLFCEMNDGQKTVAVNFGKIKQNS